MGCDIHLMLERKFPTEEGTGWVMIHSLDNCKAGQRNYDRFAALAGVRGDGPPARGLPKDVSRGTQYHVDEWGSDGHSHSYLFLKEFLDVCNSTDYGEYRQPASQEWDSTCWHWLGCGVLEEEPVTNEQKAEKALGIPSQMYRVVFWFDN